MSGPGPDSDEQGRARDPPIASDDVETRSFTNENCAAIAGEALSTSTQEIRLGRVSLGENNKKLRDAVHEGRGAEVKKLLDQGAQIDFEDQNGYTALNEASQKGDEYMVKILLERNPNLRSRNKWGMEPLHCAATEGHAHILDLLLDRGAAIEAKTNKGVTALHLASRLGRESVMGTLFGDTVNADVRARDNHGWEPLHYAATYGHAHIVRLLLRQGAEIEAKTDADWTALLLASWYGYASVVEELLEKKADVRTRANDCQNPLYRAALNGNVTIVRLLLAAGATTDFQGPLERTPLMTAALGKKSLHTEVARTLLAEGAMVNAQDENGSTALLLATWSGNLDTLKLLLEYKADVGIVDTDNSAVLHAVVRNKNNDEREAMARLLLRFGADISPINAGGRTPLHYACEDGEKVMTGLLLEHNVQVDAVDKNGWTALHLASSEGYGDVVQLLLENGADAKMKTSDTGQTALNLAIIASTSTEKQTSPKRLRISYSGKVVERTNSAEESRTSALERLAEKIDLAGKELALREVTEQTGVDALKEFATKPEKHSLVCVMLEDKNISYLKKPSSALQWAAYHGRHDVAWWILKNTKPSKELDKDREKAKQIADSRTKRLTGSRREQMADPRNVQFHINPIEEEGSDQRKAIREVNTAIRRAMLEHRKAEQEKDEYSFTLDILRDPPLVIGMSESDEPFERPSFNKALEDVDGFDATVVDFYHHNGRVDFLRRSRNVFSVIYSQQAGVEKIMDEARKLLEKISPEAAEEKKYSQEDLQFRWIHLPANNIEWMQDLVKRVCLDESKTKDEYTSLRNFLRKSWQELPAESSETKFMKPTCLKDESVKKKDRDQHALDGATQKLKQQALRSQNGIKLSNVLSNRAYFTTSYKSRKEGEERILEADTKGEHNRAEEHSINREKRNQHERELGNFSMREKEPPTERKYHYVTTGTTEDDINTKKKDVTGEEKEDPIEGKSKSVVGVKSMALNADHGDISKKQTEYQRVALYMPYITFGKSYPEGVQVPSHRKYEDLIKVYKEKMIHGSRSLDQFYYDSLPNLSDRDAGQVVTRYLTGGKRQHEVQKLKDWPFLTVNQLWLWVIDEKTIITSSTHRPDELEDPVLEKVFNYLREERGKGKEQPPPSSASEMSRFIVNFCIDFINHANWDPITAGRSARQIFADTVNKAALQEAILFEDFTSKVRHKREESKGTSHESQEKPRKLKDSLETEDWKSISKAADLLEEVKDIRDELKILKSLLAQQRTVWKGLFDDFSDKGDERGPIDTMDEIDEMIETAEAIQSSVNDILNLEQNGINITEAVLSRAQGRTLMIFTIVTIIFLPLSFLASLFALNISVFQHDHQGNLSYEPGWIFPIILCISAGVSVPLIVSAFYVEKMTRMFKGLLGKEKFSEDGEKVSASGELDRAHHWGLKARWNRLSSGIRTGQPKTEGQIEWSEKTNGELMRANGSTDADEKATAVSDTSKFRFFRHRRRPSLTEDDAGMVGEKIV